VDGYLVIGSAIMPTQTLRAAIARFWNTLAVVLRALLVAGAILALGVAPWSALAAANLRYGTSVPWAAVVEWVWLACLLTYLSGWGPPASTSAARRRFLRAHAVARPLWIPTLVATIGFGCALISLSVVGWMLARLPSGQLDEFRAFGRLPPHVVLPLLLTGSLVAGMVEEAAFRGYLQVPLEDRYGARVAIIVVAVVFTAAHLPPLPMLPAFVVLAMGWGALAYLSGSILPGVVCHFLVDAAVWLWAWSNTDGLDHIMTSSVFDDGAARLPFAAVVAAALVCSAVALVGFRQLSRAPSAPPAAPVAPH
jgi:membrane protease YdiL (CAAX protease family)